MWINILSCQLTCYFAHTAYYSTLQHSLHKPPFHHTELYRAYSMRPRHIAQRIQTCIHTYIHIQAVTHTDNSLGSNECYHYCNYIESQVVYSTSLASIFNITYTRHYQRPTLPTPVVTIQHCTHQLAITNTMFPVTLPTFMQRTIQHSSATDITTIAAQTLLHTGTATYTLHCYRYNIDPHI